MTEQTDKPNYKKTINRPKTSFAMKANLVQREPEFEKRWDKMDLYQRMREATQQRSNKRFVFHDGPPYANGDIHIGHLLNKVLKDLVVRTKLMAGFDTPFVPGWDCHGLPIEHRVMKDLGDAAKTMEPIQIRRKCKSYAEKFVKRQAKQMQRLGTIGEYDNPYITMDPTYEAATIEVFADLVEKGLVYRALKPVHWSIANQTALADAELEYYDREDTSVYVLFRITDAGACGLELPGAVDLMIWTTTPWTLPANMAVAVSERAEYSLFEYYRDGETRYVIMAEDLHKQVFEKEGLETSQGHKRLGTVKGSELVGMTYRHPFIDRTSPVVAADYVTLEDGTGLVHTAPGHGVEDYQTGLRVGLDIYCPVQADGTFDDTAPDWLQAKSVWDANPLVVEKLRDSGHLFHAHQFTHSYPHDWRSKTPTIFRATEQWFIRVDARPDPPTPGSTWVSADSMKSLRDRALEVVRDYRAEIGILKEQLEPHHTKPGSLEREELGEPGGDEQNLRDELARLQKLQEKSVHFIPEWGRNRMRGMLDSRPDWCISRQRSWGLPIPVFTHKETGEALRTGDSVRHIAKLFREKGSDVWFVASAEELLEDCPGVDNPADWIKGTDIFDVWFESGSSWKACMEQRKLTYKENEKPWHTDMYLEGSDQHRGWFQLSLLPALGATGRPPFGTVLTHGFMVDAKGEKMSKSGGNAINVEELMKDYGADVCRWWVASLNYANDVKVDWEFFRLAGEEYRKVRNTIRFLLSNLDDYAPGSDRRELTADDAHTIDAWAWGEYAKLVATVRKAYDGYNFRVANEAIFDFCNETMSAIYLAASKDRLYCDAPGSDRRRRTQTVIYDIVEGLIRLVAPILVHTADEAWLALHGLDTKSDETVHTHPLPEVPELKLPGAWAQVVTLRDRVLKRIEDARAQRGIDNPLDVGVTVLMPSEQYAELSPFEDEMADLCGVSRFRLAENGSETIEIDDLRDEPRCDRSWKRDGTVKQRSDGGWLSDRDAEAVGVT